MAGSHVNTEPAKNRAEICACSGSPRPCGSVDLALMPSASAAEFAYKYFYEQLSEKVWSKVQKLDPQKVATVRFSRLAAAPPTRACTPP